MKEKHIQSEFGKRNTIFGVFELKLCKGKSIRWDAVSEHQIDALLSISTGKGFYHKITDPPVYSGMKTRFNAKRPFDCFNLRHADAYVVVCFYEPRKKKNLYYIRIGVYLEHMRRAERRSYREDEAALMACKIESYLK